MKEKLTPEQLKNWRKVLTTMVGPYALIMPDEEIEAIRNRIQARIEKMSKDKAEGERIDYGDEVAES